MTFKEGTDNHNIYWLTRVKSSTINISKNYQTNNTTIYSTRNEERPSVVERWNRTIKQRIHRIHKQRPLGTAWFRKATQQKGNSSYGIEVIRRDYKKKQAVVEWK